eukprot:gene3025-2007_t
MVAHKYAQITSYQELKATAVNHSVNPTLNNAVSTPNPPAVTTCPKIPRLPKLTSHQPEAPIKCQAKHRQLEIPKRKQSTPLETCYTTSKTNTKLTSTQTLINTKSNKQRLPNNKEILKMKKLKLTSQHQTQNPNPTEHKLSIRTAKFTPSSAIPNDKSIRINIRTAPIVHKKGKSLRLQKCNVTKQYRRNHKPPSHQLPQTTLKSMASKVLKGKTMQTSTPKQFPINKPNNSSSNTSSNYKNHKYTQPILQVRTKQIQHPYTTQALRGTHNLNVTHNKSHQIQMQRAQTTIHNESNSKANKAITCRDQFFPHATKLNIRRYLTSNPQIVCPKSPSIKSKSSKYQSILKAVAKYKRLQEMYLTSFNPNNHHAYCMKL